MPGSFFVKAFCPFKGMPGYKIRGLNIMAATLEIKADRQYDVSRLFQRLIQLGIIVQTGQGFGQLFVKDKPCPLLGES